MFEEYKENFISIEDKVNICRVELDEDSAKLLIAMNMLIDSKDDIYYEIINEIKNDSFLAKVILKRIEVLELKDYIDEDIVLGIPIFNLNTPGEAVMYLIRILEDVIKKETKYSFKDVVLDSFGSGWYSKDTIREIIDENLKTKKATLSSIY